MKNDDSQDKRPDFEELVRRTEVLGYRFSCFDISCEDDCLPIDVEWNYKDLVHVGHVHSHMSRHVFYTGKDIYTTIDLQKILGVTVPQSVVSYATEGNQIIYQTTLFIFIIYVEVSYERIDDMTTRTRSRYAIGVRSKFLQLFTPLIRYALRRNWVQFTADDRPLRKRRGELRQKGFSFIDQSPIDHRATLNIKNNGVMPPINLPPPCVHEFEVADHIGCRVLIGEADHLGLQIFFTADVIRIFPRLCPHRGAILDTTDETQTSINCPWHGRQIAPLIEIPLAASAQVFEGLLHRCRYDGRKLIVETKSDPIYETSVDWTSRWVSSS